MPLYAYSDELRLEFRRRHRAGVRASRARKRRQRAASEPKRAIQADSDRQIDLAIARDTEKE